MKSIRHLLKLLAGSMLLLGATNHALAEDKPPKGITVGEERTLFSKILNEERTVLVSTPFDYEKVSQRYPVLFVLDGPENFHHTASITRFLARNWFMPDTIVVAVANTDRTRDLTPVSQEPGDKEQFPTHGGAAKFRAFIAEELIPWVDSKYRTRPYRTLVGHSFGGLFVVDTLLTRPELFNSYIAISPSMQWNGQRLVGQAETFFSQPRALNTTLYMTLGNEGGATLAGVRKLVAVLGEKAPAGLTWDFERMPAESHGSIPLKSTYQGLEYIYSEWSVRNPFEMYNRDGIEAIERFYTRSNRRYGYEGRGVPETAIASVGSNLLRAGRLDELSDLLDRYRKTVKPPVSVLERMAIGYRERGQTDRAIELYRRALEADAKSEVARKGLTELGNDYSDLVPTATGKK